MGWLNDSYITNNFATEEVKLIVVILIVLVVLMVAYAIFKAYHNHMKSVVKNVAAKEMKLNNLP